MNQLIYTIESLSPIKGGLSFNYFCEHIRLPFFSCGFVMMAVVIAEQKIRGNVLFFFENGKNIATAPGVTCNAEKNAEVEI